METRGLMTALAALSLMAAPVLADEQAPETDAAPAPETPVAQSSAGQGERDSAPEAPAAEGNEEPQASDEVKPGPAKSEPAKTEPAKAEEKAPQRMALQPAPPAAGEQPPAGQEAAGPAPAPKFTYGGQADFYFISNFNNPFDMRNALRAWDYRDERGPHLGLIEVWGEYARDPVGGRIDLNFGPTARINNSTDQSGIDEFQYFQQLYLSANLTKDGRTYVDVGKWVTPIGFEVIEPINNWFYSQGVMFTWPIPFWHFGGRAYHYFNDSDYVMANINTGWGTITPPDDAGLNFGFTGSKKMSDRLTLTASYMGGDNFAGFNDPEWRHLLNAVAVYQPNPEGPWTFAFDGTVGFQQDFRVAPGASTETAPWFGIQAQGKYQIDTNQYAAVRGEYLNDVDGVLFGGLGTPGTANGMQVYTVALNYTRTVAKYLQFRLEYRHDFASGGRPFSDSRRNTFNNDQGTITIAAIAFYQ